MNNLLIYQEVSLTNIVFQAEVEVVQNIEFRIEKRFNQGDALAFQRQHQRSVPTLESTTKSNQLMIEAWFDSKSFHELARSSLMLLRKWFVHSSTNNITTRKRTESCKSRSGMVLTRMRSSERSARSPWSRPQTRIRMVWPAWMMNIENGGDDDSKWTNTNWGTKRWRYGCWEWIR